MSAWHRLGVGLVALALVAGFRSDRPPAVGRVAALRAAIAPPGTAALPRFALFGWVSPPRDHATAERYAELAEAGFDVTVLAWEDSGTVADNRARLDFTRPLGVRNLILDMRLDRLVHDMPSTFGIVDTVAATYRDDPALLGYYLGDEPTEERFAWLGRAFELFRQADPAHPAWNNLLGPAPFASRSAWFDYLRAYIAATSPAVLSMDHYDFRLDGDLGRFVEAQAGAAAVAREAGIPFWSILQLTQHLALRPMTEGLLRWQCAHALAFGARGLGIFTYWTPAPDSAYGWRHGMVSWGTAERTDHFEMVRRVLADMRVAGEVLAGATWLATSFSGGGVPVGGTAFAPDSLVLSLEGRATLGVFADSLGSPILLVANRDSSASGTLVLELGGDRRVVESRSDYTYRVLETTRLPGRTRVLLHMAPGGASVLRISGPLATVGGTSLLLQAHPGPASGSVRFTAVGLSGPARLELLDLSGRRVWGIDLTGATANLEWQGQREQGGRVPPGVYLARLEDARGVRVQRVHWLGGR